MATTELVAGVTLAAEEERIRVVVGTLEPEMVTVIVLPGVPAQLDPVGAVVVATDDTGIGSVDGVELVVISTGATEEVVMTTEVAVEEILRYGVVGTCHIEAVKLKKYSPSLRSRINITRCQKHRQEHGVEELHHE